MEVGIISREIITPSSSNPNHVRVYKLSHLDQLNIDKFVPIVYFYTKAPKNSDLLKKSLSEALIQYYPLAGRVKDHLSVDCDGHGVSFVEARVAGDMYEVMKQNETDPQEQLMPCTIDEMFKDRSILAVQVTYFGCGGVGICFLFRHVIIDGTTFVNFVKSWAEIAACGGNTDAAIKDVVFDCTSIFPPEDPSSAAREILFSMPQNTVRKRFVFEGSKLSPLREKIGSRPTRFETVFALIWDAVNAEKTEGDDFIASIPVNLRKKMVNPPIPQQCIGNICTIIIANLPTEETSNYSELTQKVRELVSMVNDDHVREAFPNGWLLHRAKTGVGRSSSDHANARTRLFLISSLCGLPMYKTDFGWGNPVMIAPVGMFDSGHNILVWLFGTSDGKGVEAWVTMSKEEMAKFQQDPVVVAYASF